MRRPRKPRSSCASTRFAAAAVLAVVLFSAAGGARSALASSTPAIADSSEELDLLAVRLGEVVLTDNLACLQTAHGIQVPLEALCQLLELAVHVDTANGVASGFLVREGRDFELNLMTNRIRSGGLVESLTPSAIRRRDGDFYCDAADLSRWLPVRLDLDPYNGVLLVVPREALPIQSRWERQRRIAGNLSGLAPSPILGPRLPLPYRPVDFPFLDQTLTVATAASNAAGPRISLEHSAYLTSDLFFAEAGGRTRVDTRRGTAEWSGYLAHRDPDARVLGPLAAREVVGGEVSFPGMDLVARPAADMGLLVSSFPLTQPTEFDQHTFRGDLPPGWEVELYRNSALIGYQQAGPLGTYSFENVPLLFGTNSFERVFYGPQGQRRTEDNVFLVGANLTPPGESYYRAALSGFGPANRRSLLEWNQGITSSLSTSLGLVSAPVAGSSHSYATAGFRLLGPDFLGSADFVKEEGRGWLINGALQGRVRGLGLLFRQTRASGFRSEVWPTPSSERTLTRLRLDATLAPGFLPAVPVVVEASRDQADASRWTDQLVGRISCGRRGFSVTEQTVVTRFHTLGPVTGRTSGMLLLNRQFRRLAVRGELDYDAGPSGQGSAVSLTAEMPRGTNVIWSAGINSIPGRNAPRYQLGYETNGRTLGARVLSGYQPGVGPSLSVSLSLGMSREPRSGEWSTYGHGVASGGAASAQVFVDSNGNGIRDAGELPIPGAALLVNNVARAESTSEQGVAFLTNLPGEQHVSLAVFPGSLEDPQWVLEDSSVQWVPRPGRTARVDFPVMLSGELSGSVFKAKEAGGGPLGGAELELIADPTGLVVRRTRSDFDGFYDFTELRPGDYTVRLRPEAMARWKMESPPARLVRVSSGGTSMDGVNFAVNLVSGAMPRPQETYADLSPLAAPVEIAAPQGKVESPSSTGGGHAISFTAPWISALNARSLPGRLVPAPLAKSAGRLPIRAGGIARAGVSALPSGASAPDSAYILRPGPRPGWFEPIRVIVRSVLRWLLPGSPASRTSPR